MLEYPLLVNVSFVDNSNTPPSYYTYGAFDTNLQVGDLVVLNTGHHGMTVGNITKVFGENDNPVKVKYNREVIGKVDSSAYTEEKEKAKKRFIGGRRG
jgi:rRNA processing protein Gar1